MTTATPDDFANPFDDPATWGRVVLGGVPIRATLVAINGVSTKDEWQKSKSKETSGAVAKFNGTTWGDPKLTLEACDRDDFADLRRVWLLLKPTKGATGSAAPSSSSTTQGTSSATFSAKAGSPTAASSTAALGGTSGGDFKIPGNESVKTQSVGPRPPTIPIENPILAWHEITAIARGEWDGPYPTETNSWRVELTVIADKPPRPAGTGTMAPAASGGAAFAGSAVTPEGGGSSGAPPQETIGKNAKAGAGGV